ncbi:hypothetical protein T01_4633, partial [Trichinella spiralis]
LIQLTFSPCLMTLLLKLKTGTTELLPCKISFNEVVNSMKPMINWEVPFS